MKLFLRIVIGLALVAFTAGVSALLWVTRPQAEERPPEDPLPVVEVMEVAYGEVVPRISTQGMVESTRRSRIAAEVPGRVVSVAGKFRPGHRFEEGEVMVAVDGSDYRAALARERSALADAESALADEEARAEQAERDRRRLGVSAPPTDLALRLPQLRSARARAEAARAAVAKAENDLARTEIRAPYDCIVAQTFTEAGSYLSPGSEVAEVFASSPYEIRLPLAVDEYPFLETDEAGNPVGEVEVRASFAGSPRTWTGRIVRAEGEIDRATRSAYVVARVEASAGEEAPFSLRPGLFVEAAVTGRRLEGLAAVPFSAFLDLERVVVVDPDDRLRFRRVEVLFREDGIVYVSGGLAEGERLSLTELPRMVEGVRVQPVLAAPGGPGAPHDPRPDLSKP